MQLLEGKLVAEGILGQLKENMQASGIRPCLVVILVGNDPASHLYVSLKERAAARVGIEFRKILFPEDVSPDQLLEEIRKLNADTSVHGILVQLPLPAGLRKQVVINVIDPSKDVDGFHPESIRRFLEGKEVTLTPVFPRAVLELIHSAKVPLEGKVAMVVANSVMFGEMMVAALEKAGLQAMYVLRSHLNERSFLLKSADIVVSACGEPKLLHTSLFKSGAIVIDGGISKVDEKVVGDVDAEGRENFEGFLSPVPGGVGPVTVACLLDNVFQAAKQRV
jgi:methylenetetrahydrofolate dehydrogenase (NADP+)/methenyltetrahydrofolate cyclohydrolase